MREGDRDSGGRSYSLRRLTAPAPSRGSLCKRWKEWSPSWKELLPQTPNGASSLKREPLIAALPQTPDGASSLGEGAFVSGGRSHICLPPRGRGTAKAVEGVTPSWKKLLPQTPDGASSLKREPYIKFKLTFAQKTPSSAVKSYIPSYLFVVEITERIPMPYSVSSKVRFARQGFSTFISRRCALSLM